MWALSILERFPPEDEMLIETSCGFPTCHEVFARCAGGSSGEVARCGQALKHLLEQSPKVASGLLR